MHSLFDSHCHLAAAEFQEDLSQVLERNQQANVQKLLLVGTDLISSQACLALAKQHANFRASVGVHPHDSSQVQDDASWQQVVALAINNPFVAVGETGLDYYYKHSPPAVQKQVFAKHIALARQLDLPLVIHCRDAYADLADILDQEGQGKCHGVIHCFTGNAQQAKMFLERGFFISFSGIVTFKSADELREACKIVPLDKLLIETDAPFLAPVPLRGKRNEPSFIVHTLERIAAVRGEDVGVVARATFENASKLFS